MNGFLNIKRAPPREPRRITFGAEVRIEDLKDAKQPQIEAEMPEAVAEVEQVLAESYGERGESIHNEVNQPPRKKRGRPKGSGKKEHKDEPGS